MHTNMRKILLPVTPDYLELESECPRTSAIALIHGGNTSLTPLEDEFVFPENKDGQTPFYRFTREEVKASTLLPSRFTIYSSIL